MIRKTILYALSMLFLVSCTLGKQSRIEALGLSKSEIPKESAIHLSNQPAIGSVEVIGGDEASLRDFIQKWFVPFYSASTDGKGTTIWIGRMPEILPVDFPIPADSKIIASVQDPYTALQVLFETNTQPDDFLALYSKSLESGGWSPAPQQSHGGGFTAAADPFLSYCIDQDLAALTVQVFKITDEKTDVRLGLNTENIKYLCDPDFNPGMDPSYEILPVLKMPVGVLMTGGGTSSDSGSAESSSDIKTELPLKELMAHFSSQLEDAGWQFLDGNNLDNLAFSSWLILDNEGEEWRGTLILLVDQVQQDLVYALVRVIKVVK
jgi:hypothetical protein